MTETSLKNKNSKTQRKPRPPKKITERYLHNAGLYYLERFSASSAHFRTVMMRKIDRSCDFHKDQKREDCITALNAVIETFQRAGLLNDALYAQGMVHSLRRRGLSTRMIHARLQAKGLSRDMVSAAITGYDEEQGGGNPELSAALRLAARKKIGPFSRPNEWNETGPEKKTEKSYEKAMGIMARAGFSYDIVKQVMDMSPDDARATNGSGGY